MSITCIASTSYFATPDFLLQAVHIITAISFPIHILGLYIILFKTPKQMSSVKWYFVNLHFWIVIYDNSLGFFTVPFLLFPAMSGYSLGVLSYLGFSEFLMVVLVLLTCINMQLSILAICENRFFIVCDFPWKNCWEKCRHPWIVFHYIFAVSVFIPMGFMLPDQEVSKQHVLAKLPCVSDYVHDARIFTLTEDYTYHLGVLVPFLIVGVLEGAFFIFYLLFYIIHQVKSRRMSQITLKLQIKFLVAVLIQVLVPMVLMVVPLGYSGVVILNDYYNQAYINVVIALETMHGLFSTLTMIFIHHPYRTALISMFPKCWRRGVEDSSLLYNQRSGSVFPTQT